MELLHSPLAQWHRDAGARMVDFHGWEMPLHYQRVSDEVLATRRSVGLFDLCHMGRVDVRGPRTVEFLDLLFTNNVERMAEGQVVYGFLCNDAGGVIDDVTIYRADDHLMLVVNASNREDVLAWMQQHRGEFRDVKIEDKTTALGMCAIQGPKAIEIVAALSNASVTGIERYTFREVRVAGHLCLASRTGYTGEDGFELYFGTMNANAIWKALAAAAKEAGGCPVGLAARDTLRLEAGLPLHGQELTTGITPIEACLERFVDFGKRKFVGRMRLLDTTNSDVSTRLVAFEVMGRAIPRTGQSLCAHEAECGRVTSGEFSPTLEKSIGLGYVEQEQARVGQMLQVRIREQYFPALVVRRPFYRRGKTPS